MSTKAHKLIGLLNGVLFAVAGSFLETNTFPSLAWLWRILVGLHGGMAVLALKPVFGAGKTEEPSALKLPPGSSTRALLPLLFIPALLCSGCATTKTLLADEATQCGAKAAAALAQTEGVLMTATDAASAVANIGTIIGAAASDVSAVYCIVEVAVADLKAKRSMDGGAAPAETQMRALVTGVYAYPTDPIAHGIAVGQDILALKK
jgi:hypothetical protein